MDRKLRVMSMKWLIRTLAVLAMVVVESVSAGTVTYMYTDPQGTPLAESDVNGNITATFDYRPYGVQVLGVGPNGPGYTGHVNDPDTGLIYMQARYYDASIGRFLSMDPVAPGDFISRHFNRYSYAYNNPNLYKDYDGRCPVCFLVFVGISLFTTSDYANAPGPRDVATSMSPAEKLSAITEALPPGRAAYVFRVAINTSDRLSQRAAAREAKRQAGIPTSQQPKTQSNGSANDGTKVGRQQTYETPKPGGGTEQKSVQVSRDVEGDHANMPQIEAGPVKTGGQVDQAGRPRIQNEGKVRVDFDPAK